MTHAANYARLLDVAIDVLRRLGDELGVQLQVEQRPPSACVIGRPPGGAALCFFEGSHVVFIASITDAQDIEHVLHEFAHRTERRDSDCYPYELAWTSRLPSEIRPAVFAVIHDFILEGSRERRLIVRGEDNGIMGVYDELLDFDDDTVACPVEGCDRRFLETETTCPEHGFVRSCEDCGDLFLGQQPASDELVLCEACEREAMIEAEGTAPSHLPCKRE